MRLIDADALIPKGTKVTDDVIAVHNAIKKAPTIEAEPVRHGYWIPREHDDGFGAYMMNHCSECDTLEAKSEKFCRECGAKMDQEAPHGEKQ